jgi:CII-binding regulator of phage lambda lysogenization HflD
MLAPKKPQEPFKPSEPKRYIERYDYLPIGPSNWMLLVDFLNKHGVNLDEVYIDGSNDYGAMYDLATKTLVENDGYDIQMKRYELQLIEYQRKLPRYERAFARYEERLAKYNAWKEEKDRKAKISALKQRIEDIRKKYSDVDLSNEQIEVIPRS